MARLLACWELGLGFGHLTFLASAARALSGLGHESWLASRDVVTARVLGDRPFARVLQAPVWSRSRVSTPTLTWTQVVADGGFADEDGLIELVRAWLALFELSGAQAIYGEHAPASLLAAHVAGLPATRMGSRFMCPVPSKPMPSLMPWAKVSTAERARADALGDRVVRGVCRHFGAKPLDGVAEWLAGVPAFLTSWPELDHWGANTGTYYGPLSGIAATAPPDWPDAPGPRVFVYLPFEREVCPAVAEALRQRGWPAIWVCATAPPFALPANVRHEMEPLDPLRTLREARLFIGRAGHASSMDALRGGCPQLLVPDYFEAQTLAVQLDKGGYGRLAEAWDAASIGADMDRLVAEDAPERAACARAAAKYADYDPALATAQLGRDLAAALHL